MTEQEYYRLARACDRVLRHPAAALEWVAIPWLHVVCQHPVILANYQHVVEELYVRGTHGIGLPRRMLAVARNLLRAAMDNGFGGERILTRALPQLHRADVIIVSWLVNVEHLQMADDFYFGDLQTRLAQRGLSSLLVLRNQTSHPTHNLLERARREGPCSRMILPDVVGPSSEAGFVRRCFRAHRELRPAEREATSLLDRRVAREARRQVISTPTITNLRLHAQIGNLCRQLRPSVVITLYEGHAWERCVWHAARMSLPSVLCVGYQHTILWQHSHGIRRSLGSVRGFDPDLILTVGHVTRQVLETAPDLQAVPILTYGTHRRADSRALANAPRFVPTFLVLPEGHESECIYLFNFALECARRLPDARFIFRTHSILPFEIVGPKLNGYHLPPSNVEVSRDSQIEDDFARAGYVLYRGSSTVIHAILAGLKPFYVARSGELNIDPLYALPAWRECVFSVDDLVAKYVAHPAQARRADIEEWKWAQEFCNRYVQPVREDVVDEILEFVRKAPFVETGSGIERKRS